MSKHPHEIQFYRLHTQYHYRFVDKSIVYHLLLAEDLLYIRLYSYHVVRRKDDFAFEELIQIS